ncbi:O-acetylhomoserine aminocarboxypropyltransferase/cysteine synthase family protein [Subtercola boreus]|uniref:homocysteine desulfhydrase n=1 Tax=Subtercola boreus TaxID=120213 RepID=A0A3E0WCS3_9MICO|nr:PLP-dependent transferase [Subtercola boreus]RFA21155.1 O-acetylhomoserine aminocarboxypropyltransferase [Subtercola boreus]RFA21538.1 O-acetylhomoserine aminocarboxypropyltransferase [Subtercola boreus]RFA27508.1 O-acetylhomoserine aminocarboxypropyltransferase [Subtercola boreus]
MTTTQQAYGEDNFGFATEQVHAGEIVGGEFGARITPIYLTAGFLFDSFDHAEARFRGHDGGLVYTRYANPTNAAVEAKLTALERGVDSLLVASGQAAITVALLGILKSGDHFLSTPSLYEGSKTLFRENFARLGIEVEFVDDPHDLDDWRRRIRPTTRAIYGETIPNPKNDLIDIDLIAGFAREQGLPFVIDSTASTPYLIRPIEHGANIVVHSASKFLSGHGASLAGVVVDGGNFDWARYPEKFPQFSTPIGVGAGGGENGPGGPTLVQKFGRTAYLEYTRTVIAGRLGPTLSPLNAFLLQQGLETLSLRVERHCLNALAVASWLEDQPEVLSVDYPGLASSPSHAIAVKHYPRGTGSVFGFTLAGGRDAARTLIDSVELFSRMSHMGDVRSLILHPGTTSHAHLTDDQRSTLGIHPGLIRLSIGIEDETDLLEDLERAFAALRASAGIGRREAPAPALVGG